MNYSTIETQIKRRLRTAVVNSVLPTTPPHRSNEQQMSLENTTAKINSLSLDELRNEGIIINVPSTSKSLMSESILTLDAVRFLAQLHRRFNPRRLELILLRQQKQREIDAGNFPDFLEETRFVRESEWSVNPVPTELQDRRVEITGPVDRKMIINALNSGANCFMADFEDANAPTFDNNIQGQINLRDAVNRTITLSGEGKEYRLVANPAVLFVRPRGWHMIEKHMLVDGQPISASLFDFGLYFYHNALTLVNKAKSGPYFYLPKMESYLEARLWNDVFLFAQEKVSLPQGTIKATVLIETITAAFQMDEILYELRQHSAGLNCGRWDYIFSLIKKFQNHAHFVLPDRHLVTMNQPFMRSYVQLLIKTCHRRGAHAMGGMAAQIPIRNNVDANEAALAKVRVDKEFEANQGHDGTWVAHPGLIDVARTAFDSVLAQPNGAAPLKNQVETKMREDVQVSAADLLSVPKGPITEHGIRTNISIGIQYLAAWIKGRGAVPLNHLMEDLATAEISRCQVWQCIRHQAKLDDGRVITQPLIKTIIVQEVRRLRELSGGFTRDDEIAALLFENFVISETLDDFMSIRAYEYLS